MPRDMNSPIAWEKTVATVTNENVDWRTQTERLLAPPKERGRATRLRVRFIASRSRLWKYILDSSTMRLQYGSYENSVSRIGNGAKRRESGAAPECKGEGNGRSPRKPADQQHCPALVQLAEESRAARLAIETGSTWCNAHATVSSTGSAFPYTASASLYREAGFSKVLSNLEVSIFAPLSPPPSFSPHRQCNAHPSASHCRLNRYLPSARAPHSQPTAIPCCHTKQTNAVPSCRVLLVAAVSLLTSHHFEPGSISVSQVGIVSDDAADRWVFSGSPSPPRPCIPALLHSHIISPSSALKTSLLRATKIAQLNPDKMKFQIILSASDFVYFARPSEDFRGAGKRRRSRAAEAQSHWKRAQAARARGRGVEELKHDLCYFCSSGPLQRFSTGGTTPNGSGTLIISKCTARILPGSKYLARRDTRIAKTDSIELPNLSGINLRMTQRLVDSEVIRDAWPDPESSPYPVEYKTATSIDSGKGTVFPQSLNSGLSATEKSCDCRSTTNEWRAPKFVIASTPFAASLFPLCIYLCCVFAFPRTPVGQRTTARGKKGGKYDWRGVMEKEGRTNQRASSKLVWASSVVIELWRNTLPMFAIYRPGSRERPRHERLLQHVYCLLKVTPETICDPMPDNALFARGSHNSCDSRSLHEARYTTS
ncbi:hypothetical protein PR048_016852 [Dryococelus australis]|uniref:Uncharacterized protein n=1 Tax=Dryococelus australis TaxID=614101 RepID=A0ABQ9H7U8_9NEOP|nr:hypothetical protein PR048_016852 [Dryococelus australis]